VIQTEEANETKSTRWHRRSLPSTWDFHFPLHARTPSLVKSSASFADPNPIDWDLPRHAPGKQSAGCMNVSGSSFHSLGPSISILGKKS
jgi:hypothetical protein